MRLSREQIKIIQAELNARGFDAGAVDGVAGRRTAAAMAMVTEIPPTWPHSRRLIALLQLACQKQGIDVGVIDGYWGPQTEFAVDSLRYQQQHGSPPPLWRDALTSSTDNPNGWPNETEVAQFYGERGEQQRSLQLPYPHRLAWDQRQQIHHYSCHQQVHDSLLRVLTRVQDHYGFDEIKRLHLDLWCGCLNVRKMRGGSRWSMHSWGVAVDYDPTHNGYQWGRDRAAFAAPAYEPWWQCWQDEGWLSLGREKNYDWMHIQAVRVK